MILQESQLRARVIGDTTIKNSSFQVVGVDIGGNIFGVSIWEVNIFERNSALKLVDYYTGLNEGKNHDEKLWSLYCFFNDNEWNIVAGADQRIFWLEDIPWVRNSKSFGQLKEYIGAAKVALFEKGLVHTVNNTVWKKETVGKGNARKHDVYIWLTGQGHVDPDTLSEDAIDGICIGLFGCQRLIRQYMHDHASVAQR